MILYALIGAGWTASGCLAYHLFRKSQRTTYDFQGDLAWTTIDRNFHLVLSYAMGPIALFAAIVCYDYGASNKPKKPSSW